MDFNSHTPHGVRQHISLHIQTRLKNFNSHTPHGVRHLYRLRRFCLQRNFNSHTPHGVRLKSLGLIHKRNEFQLTHPTRGATAKMLLPLIYGLISTHTPHTGCDQIACYSVSTFLHFNSHTPHGVRLIATCDTYNVATFQLTHPTRGATFLKVYFQLLQLNFNSHTPHGVRQVGKNLHNTLTRFQLTHPTRGATLSKIFWCISETSFQLTHPTRGATQMVLIKCLL